MRIPWINSWGTKRKFKIIGIGVAIALCANFLVPVVNDGFAGPVTVGKHAFTITVGNEAHAAAEADYICDGVDDDVQLQLALNDLPVQGGKVVILAGGYSLSATVARPIDNVTIEGLGHSTQFSNDGVTAIFSAGGQTGWHFRYFETDAGGVDVSLASAWVIEDVLLGAIYYTRYTDDVVTFRPSADNDDYVTFGTNAENIPTIYGTGAYLRVGDAGTTGHTLASEDDLLVTGKLEVDGFSYLDDSLYMQPTKQVIFDSGGGQYPRIFGHNYDANAKMLMITFDEGGAVYVPVLAVGDTSSRVANLGFYDGIAEPTISAINDAADAYVALDAGDVNGTPAGNGLYFFPAAAELVNVLSVGVSGASGVIKAYDTGVGVVEVARLQGAAEPYFSMGGSQNIKGYNSGKFALVEQAAALASVAGEGQFWVKDDTPNTPYFTDDAGTDHAILTGATATKHEFHMPFEDPTGQVGNWDVVAINAAQDTHFVFQIPESFESLVNANVIMIPDATETIQWDVSVSVAAAGEAYNNDDRLASNQTLAVTASDVTEVDISGQLTALTAGDYVAIDFQSDIADLRIIGFEFDYK